MILRVFSIFIGLIWFFYWKITEKKADTVKPKTGNRLILTEKIIINLMIAVIAVNLLGYVIFPFHNNYANLLGFIIEIYGFVICIWGRYSLSDNWANSYEYQIKKNHELVTAGIYRYVRHPIYGGMFLMGIGMLLTAGSYLSLVFFPAVLIMIRILADREEKLLSAHFGKKYTEYIRISKRFFPFIY